MLLLPAFKGKAMDQNRLTLETTTPAYDAMTGYWGRVNAVRGGREAMIAAAQITLPQFPKETKGAYDFRVKNARFTDIFSDIVENLASKPFTKETTVKVENSESETEEFKSFGEDVDGGNNHLQVFASDVLINGMLNAIDWILIDYPSIGPGATLADARARGARPYWLRIPADRVLMALQDNVGGKVELTYFKFVEQTTIKDDKDNLVLVDQFRIFERPYDEDTGTYGHPQFKVYRAKSWTGVGADAFELVNEGSFGIDTIPVVPYATGKIQDNQFLVRPPFRNLVDLQIEYFQEENGIKNIKTLTAFPFFVAKNMDPIIDDKTQEPVEGSIGPSVLVYTGVPDDGQAQPDIEIKEPSGNSLNFLSNDLDKLEKKMRELGRMPLVAGTAGITQVAAAFASQASSSYLQVLAMLLKDALEKAFAITAKWQGKPDSISPEVYVHTDFAIEVGDEKGPQLVLDAYKERVVSAKTVRNEFLRRGILSPDFNEEDDEQARADEDAGSDTGGGEFETNVDDENANANNTTNP